jgi:putative acetyltransferase
MDIRLENPGEAEAVRAVHDAAFINRPMVGDMTVNIRREADFLSLVAVEDGKIVGHVLFIDTPLADKTGKKVKTVNLTPLGVIPAYQKRGIGSALVRRGLEILKERGYEAVFLIGSPKRYGVYGFTADLAQNVEAPYSGPGFMGLELKKDVLKNLQHPKLTIPRAVMAMDEASALSKKTNAMKGNTP